jgi:hypothetical protein
MLERCRTLCWIPLWCKGVGLEHLLLGETEADSVVLAVDEQGGPFRLTYRLTWDERWVFRTAELIVRAGPSHRSLSLISDGHGRWCHGDGREVDELEGCIDIDIWPTPFTNTFPLRRERFEIGQRRVFRMAWISAPDLRVLSQSQAYTRLDEHRYRFESLDGSGFEAVILVDDAGIVVDYPGLFRRARFADGGDEP